MKNIFVFVILFIHCYIINASNNKGIHPDLKEAYVLGKSQYEWLERYNNANELNDKAENNFYIINLDTDWIGKYGVGKPTADVVIPEYFNSLNAELLELNNYLASKGKADRVYVCYTADLPLKILANIDFLNVKFNVVRDQFNNIKKNEPNKAALAEQSITNLNQFQTEYKAMVKQIIDGGVTPIPNNDTWSNPNRILVSQFSLRTFDIESNSGSITNDINALDRTIRFENTKTNEYVVNSYHYSIGFDPSVSNAISAKVTEYFAANPKIYAVDGILEGIKAYYHNTIILGSGQGIGYSSGASAEFNSNVRVSGGGTYPAPHAISLPQSISEYSVYDYTKILTENEKADLINQLALTLELTGAKDIKLHFYITDNRTYTEMQNGAQLQSFLANLTNTSTGGNGLVVHLHFDQSTNKMVPTLKVNGGASSIPVDHLIKVQSLLKEAMEFSGNNPLLTGAKLIIFFAVKAINVTFKFLVNKLVALGSIPEKYWNPNASGYDSTIAEVFAVLMAPQMAVAGFLFGSFGDPEVTTQTLPSCIVALFCGMWQCIINYAQEIGNAIVMITDCILYKDKREQMFEALQNITLSSVLSGMLPQFYKDPPGSPPSTSIQKKCFETGYNIIAIAVSILEAYETVVGFGALIKGLKKIPAYLDNLAGTVATARKEFIDNMVDLRRTTNKSFELFTERVGQLLRYCVPDSKLSYLDFPTRNKLINPYDQIRFLEFNLDKRPTSNWATTLGVASIMMLPSITNSMTYIPPAKKCIWCVIREATGNIRVSMNQFIYDLNPVGVLVDFAEFRASSKKAKAVPDEGTGLFDDFEFDTNDFEFYRVSDKTIEIHPKALVTLLNGLPQNVKSALRTLLPENKKQLTKVLIQMKKRPIIVSLLDKYQDMHKIWLKPNADDLAFLKDKYTDDFIKETGMTQAEIDVFEELIEDATAKSTLRNNRLNGKHLENNAPWDSYYRDNQSVPTELRTVADKVNNPNFPNTAAFGDQVRVFNGTNYSIPDKFFIEKLPDGTYKAYIADCKANGAQFTNVQENVFAGPPFPKVGLKIKKSDNVDLFNSLGETADEIVFDMPKANVYRTHATVTGPPATITPPITTSPIP